MGMHIEFYKAMFSATFWLSIFLAYVYFRRRDAAGAQYVSIIMLLNAFWAGGVLMGIQSRTIESKELSLSISFALSVFMPSALLAFVMHFLGKTKWLRIRYFILLNLPPVFFLFIAFSPVLHHLLWKVTDADFSNHVFVKTYGYLFWVVVTYGYAVITVALTLFLFNIKLFNKQSLFQGVFFLLAIILSVGSNLIQFFGIGYFGRFDMTSVGLALSFGVIFFAVYNFKVFELIPAAQEAIFKNSSNAILVVNKNNRVVLYNDSFVKCFYANNQQIEGRSLMSISAQLYEEVMKKIAGENNEAIFFKNENKNFMLWVEPITRRNNKKAGLIIILEDITERKLLEQNLYISNIHLLEQLTANENCIEDEKVIYHSIVNDLKPMLGQIMNVTKGLKSQGDTQFESSFLKPINQLGLKASRKIDDIAKYIDLSTKELTVEKVSLIKVFEDAIETNNRLINDIQAKIVLPQYLPEVNGNEEILIEAMTIFLKHILTSSVVPAQLELKVEKILNQWTSVSIKFNAKPNESAKFEAMITSNGDLKNLNFEAAGLEMFIAKRQFRSMNAEINVELGQPTTIYIRFPI